MEDTSALIAATTFGKGLKRRQDITLQPQRPPSGGAPTSQPNPPPGKLWGSVDLTDNLCWS